jgi:hypothetical protein
MSILSAHGPSRGRYRLARLSVVGLAAGTLVGGFTLLSGGVPAGASGNLYVSPYGSDTGNPCTSSSTPCLTLAHAYAVSSGGNTINLAAGTYKGGIEISHNLNIVGTASGGSLDATTSTINGGSPVLETTASSISITNVVISGADGQWGGIENTGGLTLTNVNVQDNTSLFFDGGGMFNQGNLVMTGGSFQGNTIDADAGEGGGGGLFNRGTAKLTNVSLTHNVATGSLSPEGGGIFNFLGTLKLLGSTVIHNNSAPVNGGGIEACVPLTTGPDVSVTANTPNDISSADPGGLC